MVTQTYKTNLRISLHHTESFTFWRSNGSSAYFKTLSGTERSQNARRFIISDLQVHFAATAVASITKLLFLKYILVEFTEYLPIAFRKPARHLRSFNKMVGYAPYA